MPQFTELTVVGDAGRLRIELDESSELTVADILNAAGPQCTGMAAAAVEQAIDSGRLRLLDGERSVDVDEPAGAIQHDSVTIELIAARPPQNPWTAPDDAPAPELATSAHPRPASPPALPAPAPDGPATRSALTTRPRAPAPTSSTSSPQEPPPVELPARANRITRLAGAYRAWRDGSPQSNGLPALPPATRASQAWRRSDYLDMLTRGIAAPDLTHCAVLAFLSSKGGVGKTTAAKLVAMAFADARRDRCVLIDANPDRGTLGTSFARHHTTYVDDVRAVADDPNLTPSALDGMLATGPHGLRVLPAPQNSSRRRQLGEAEYAAVIACLQRHVGIVVVDLGTDMLEGPTVAALKAACQLVVVSNEDWIAGEQTAASFWDDVRAITPAEYTIVANDISGSHAAAARRLHGQLTAPEGASDPRSVTVIAHNTGGYNKLQDRTVEWADLPHQWQRSARELTYRLAQDCGASPSPGEPAASACSAGSHTMLDHDRVPPVRDFACHAACRRRPRQALAFGQPTPARRSSSR